MISKLELKNFRQHTNLTIEFDKGVTVIRGANECGKSTIFEAITFALFGVDACRSNDITTWGAPEKSHIVKLEFDLNNQNYQVTRSAKGAELNSEGVKVTGQREVTKRCEQLLDLKPNTGINLMFASQNSIRGTLDEGNKSIQLIEQLADFDVVENYIKALQTNFSLGKYNHLELWLSELETSLIETKQELESSPNIEELELTETNRLGSELNELEAEDSHIRNHIDQINQQLETTRKVEADISQLKASINATQQNIEYLETKQAELLINCTPEAITEIAEKLKSLYAEKTKQSQLEALKADFDSYARHADRNTSIRLEGTEESLKLELETVKTQYQELNTYHNNLAAQITSLKKQICTDLICPTCKRSWDNAEEMEKINNELQTKITDLQSEFDSLLGELTQLKSQESKLRAALDGFIFFPMEGSKWVLVQDGKFPPAFTWTGGELQGIDTDLDSRIAQYEQSQRKLNDWKAQQESIKFQLADADNQLKSLYQQLNSLQVPETSSHELNGKLNHFNVELNNIHHKIKNVRQAQVDLPIKVAKLRQQYIEKQQKLDNIQLKIKQTKVEIKDIQVNNTLLKVLREIKPQLANTIWQQVCSTISHYFSIMRDQQSVVTKASSGFEVDDHNTKALSGSTLDVLGIAIRVALTKTFLPTCRFMLLDEPFAACDTERQTKALGFITSAGFDQVIIVTHEDTTEAVADNLITL